MTASRGIGRGRWAGNKAPRHPSGERQPRHKKADWGVYNKDRIAVRAARFARGLCVLCGKRDIESDFILKEVKTCPVCREQAQAYKTTRPVDFCLECLAHGFHRDDCAVDGFNVALKKALDREQWDVVEVNGPSSHRLGDTTREATQALQGDHQPAAVEVGRSFDEGLPESGPAEIDFPFPLGTTYTTLPGTKERPMGATPAVASLDEGSSTPRS